MMKVAICQMEIIWESKEDNLLQVEKYVRLAALQGGDVILFPEMTLTGFSMNIDYTGESDDYTIKKIRNLSEKYSIAIGIGWVRKSGEKGENHYTIIDQNDIVSDYIKIHPFSYAGEDKFFKCGEEIVKFELGNLKCSNFICYDLRFPEVFQIASSEAEVIIVPANWPENRKEHWKSLLKARAIENQVYIIGVNCVGEIGGLKYSGDSCVINPAGENIVQMSGQEGLILCDIKDDVKSYRERFPIKKDRKNNLYEKYYDKLCVGGYGIYTQQLLWRKGNKQLCR